MRPLFFSIVCLMLFSVSPGCEKIDDLAQKFAKKKSKKREDESKLWHKEVKDLEKKIQACVVDANRMGLFYRKIGEDHAKHRNYDQAIKYYKLAITYGEGRAEVYHDMGAIYAIKAKFEKDAGNLFGTKKMAKLALINYEKALLKDSRRLKTKFGKVLLFYYILREKEKGFRELTKLISDYPKEKRLLFSLARIYFEEEKYQRAILTYQRLQELVPENSERAKQIESNIRQSLIRLKQKK